MRELLNTLVIIVVVALVTTKLKTGKLPLPDLFSNVINTKNMLDGDTIYIQGIGRYKNSVLVNAKQIIEETYGVPAKIIDPLELTNDCYSNNSINGDICLTKFDDNKNKILLTNESCYSIYNKTFVNGLSESHGNITLVNETSYLGLKRVIIHEIGHNSGLEHCDNQNCVMSINRADDSHTLYFCDKCKKSL